jgi:hypothetical protein
MLFRNLKSKMKLFEEVWKQIVSDNSHLDRGWHLFDDTTVRFDCLCAIICPFVLKRLLYIPEDFLADWFVFVELPQNPKEHGKPIIIFRLSIELVELLK